MAKKKETKAEEAERFDTFKTDNGTEFDLGDATQRQDLVARLYQFSGAKLLWIDADKFPIQYNDALAAYRPVTEKNQASVVVRASFRNKLQSALALLPLAAVVLDEHSDMPNFGMGILFSSMCRTYEHGFSKKYLVSYDESKEMEDRVIVLWRYLVKGVWGNFVYRSVAHEFSPRGSVELWSSDAMALMGKGLMDAQGNVTFLKQFKAAQ